MDTQMLPEPEISNLIPVGEAQALDISIEQHRNSSPSGKMQPEPSLEELKAFALNETNLAFEPVVLDSNGSNTGVSGFIEELEGLESRVIELDEKFEPSAKLMKMNDGSIRTQEFTAPNPVKHFESKPSMSDFGLTPITETDRDNFSTLDKENNPLSQFGKKRNYLDFTTGNQNQRNGGNDTRLSNRPYVTLKKQLDTFFSRRSSEVSSPTKNRPIKLSKPKSPNFRTKDRIRSSASLLSTEEQILKEMEAHRQKRRQELGIQRGRSTSRTLTSASTTGEQQMVNEAPRNSARSTSVNKLTPIQPFNFECEKRSRLKSKGSPEKPEENVKLFKASPVPNYHFFEVKKSSQSCIIPKEPALHTQSRGEQKRQELAEQLKKEEQQLRMQRTFKASEIPDYSKLAQQGINQKVQLPKKTCPIEIKFHTDQRASLKTSLSAENSQEDSSKHHFKALPVPDLSRSFKPIIPKRETIEVRTFELQSEKRARERKEFDEAFRKKELEKEKQREEERRRKEEEEIKELRKKLVFKAAPIKNYSKIEIKKSEKPLVIPQAPKLTCK